MWTAGLNAVSHDVYIYFSPSDVGRDEIANADPSETIGMYRGRQTVTSYRFPELRGTSTMYIYWRIDEVDIDGNITKGDVWAFTAIPLPPSKGRTCFTAETDIWVNDTLVPFSKVVQGQSIYSMNRPDKVEEVQEHCGTFTCYDVLLESGNCISVAGNHYFLAESGQWTSLNNLNAGIKLKTLKGSIGIKSVTKRRAPYTGKVYNLKINGSDRYLVGRDAIVVRDY